MHIVLGDFFFLSWPTTDSPVLGHLCSEDRKEGLGKASDPYSQLLLCLQRQLQCCFALILSLGYVIGHLGVEA